MLLQAHIWSVMNTSDGKLKVEIIHTNSSGTKNKLQNKHLTVSFSSLVISKWDFTMSSILQYDAKCKFYQYKECRLSSKWLSYCNLQSNLMENM